MRPANRAEDAALRAGFDAALTRARLQEPALLAVSGGADSVALLSLAAAQGGQFKVATVDHGLRAESAREAAEVAAWCGALGFPHRIVRWNGATAGPALMERARAARYALLADCALREGCAAVVTAHTADDQAETLFMRLARGSGQTGLKGMAAETRIACGAGAPVRLVRPLLFARRAALRAFLDGAGTAYYDDPSNDDPRFERVRTRALLGALEEQGILTVEALCAAAERLQEAERATAAAECVAFLRAEGWVSRFGAFVVRSSAADVAAPRLPARLLQAASGEDYPPDAEAAAGAFAAAAATGAATLGGALIRRRDEQLWVMREPAALLGRSSAKPKERVAVAPGESCLWDGRFVLTNRSGAPAAAGALGPKGLAALGSRRTLFDAPDEALIAAPAALFDDGPLTVRSLAEERFFTPVVRFPKV